jgi:hypothetical protein
LLKLLVVAVFVGLEQAPLPLLQAQTLLLMKTVMPLICTVPLTGTN